MTTFLHKEITFNVIGAAMEVHRTLGAGFLESVYQKALAYELRQRNIQFQEQHSLPVWYKDVIVGEFIADFLIESAVILEIKAIETFHPNHIAQVLNYLTATKLQVALLINFGNASLQHKRFVL